MIRVLEYISKFDFQDYLLIVVVPLIAVGVLVWWVAASSNPYSTLNQRKLRQLERSLEAALQRDSQQHLANYKALTQRERNETLYEYGRTGTIRIPHPPGGGTQA